MSKHYSTRNSALAAHLNACEQAAQRVSPEDFKRVGGAVFAKKLWHEPRSKEIACWPEHMLILMPNGDLFMLVRELGLACRVVAPVEVLMDVFEPHVGRKAINTWARRAGVA
jgi:hypothetical protein